MPEPTSDTDALFAPAMPDVDDVADLPGLFAMARHETFGKQGQRAIAVVTPGRMIAAVPAPPPGTVPQEHVARAGSIIPSTGPMQIAVIANTRIEPFTADKQKCIPFLGQLLGITYLGHTIVVFEGHPSAFAAGLQENDVLLVDSGMLPFLQPDWFTTARAAMRPAGRVFEYDRITKRILPVIPSSQPPGWKTGEPDGEMSYVNCLLTALSKRPPLAVEVHANRPVPDIRPLAAPADAEWAADLPFRYENLRADLVMGIIQRIAKWSPPENNQARGELKAQLALINSDPRPVAFHLQLRQDVDLTYHLTIERSD